MKRCYCLILYTFIIQLPVCAQDQKDGKGFWFAPDFVAMQYAGSIGWLSTGIGYRLLQGKASVQTLFGYVPEFIGSETLRSLTFKVTAHPFKVNRNHLTWYPIDASFFVNYSFGDQYDSKLPNYYPSNYYWWNEAVRCNLSFGTMVLAKNKASLYFEVGSNDLKLISYFQNMHSLHLYNILHAGIGARYHFAY